MSATILDARSSVYRLLADLYARELSGEQLSSFINGNGQELLGALDTVPECAAIVAHLNRSFGSIDDPQQAVLDFAESYAWNFHGVGGPGSPSLYASTYLSKTRSTHQETESELRKIMTAHGLHSVNSDDVPYDHLSIILEFVAWLDEKGAHAEPDEVRQKVIDQYLLSWLPAFVSLVSFASSTLKRAFFIPRLTSSSFVFPLRRLAARDLF